MVWDKGANTRLLTGTEMRPIAGISEENTANTASLELSHRGRNPFSPVGLESQGVKGSVPYRTMTVHGGHRRWTDLKQVTNIIR